MFRLIGKRLATAFSTFPTATDWLQLGLPLTGLAVLLLIIGFQSKFLKVDVLQAPWQEITRIAALSLIVPAFAEEIVFRVLFLPQPTENPSLKIQLLWGAITLVAFILYHPLQGLTWNPASREVFVNFFFLTLAALLGAMCTFAYLRVGSVWLPVMIHWLAVVVWLVFLGGYTQLPHR